MTILEKLNIPNNINTRIPVKTLVEHLDADKKQKQLLESHIKSMYLVSILNEDSIKVRSYVDDDYSFESIYVFEIELKINNQITDLSNLIHSAFPESTLLILKYNDKNYLCGAMKRINKVDRTKTVIEDYTWELIDNNDEIDISNNSYVDLKQMYKEIMKMLYGLNIKRIIGHIPKNKDLDFRKTISDYNSLNAEINNLKELYKSASMQSEKLIIDNDIYTKEKQLDELVKSIKGE